jgi:hypothetical protein
MGISDFLNRALHRDAVDTRAHVEHKEAERNGATAQEAVRVAELSQLQREHIERTMGQEAQEAYVSSSSSSLCWMFLFFFPVLCFVWERERGLAGIRCRDFYWSGFPGFCVSFVSLSSFFDFLFSFCLTALPHCSLRAPFRSPF